MGESGKIVSFHHRERGRPHGAEPVILPTPIGRSRVDLPHHPCLVARPSKRHAPDAPQAGQAPTQALQSARPFTGLIHKPLCEACEQGPMRALRRLARHLLFISFTRGRQRTVDTRLTSVPIRSVLTTAGSAAETSAPMAIPAASPGASCSVSRATAISTRPTARSFMASAPRQTSSCASSRVWPKAWASEARRGSSRSIPTPSSSGWWKPPSSSRPFPRIFCTSYTSIRSNSTNSTPCSVR